MHSQSILFAFLAVSAAVGTAHAQSPHTVLFRGTPGSFGVLEQRDLAGGGPPSFPFHSEQIRLLPLEVNGRTELARTNLEQAWRNDDVPAASRVSLPAEQGSLYFFEASSGQGAHGFGFFWIDSAGRVRPVLELKGTGPAFDQNPILARVGVASDGRAIVCATTLAAGGNLLEIDLVSGGVLDRTANQPPLTWLEQSLFLAPQWGVAMHTGGVQYFARQPAAQALGCNFGPSGPSWFSGDIALSPRGKYAAFVAGTSAQVADVYVVSPLGALARATAQAAAISPAGYLPEQIDGPFLGVSDDGAQCAWRTEGLTREAFLMRVPWQAPALASQLTSNANFIDTIDEVGQFAFRTNTNFVFTAGERAAPIGGIGKIDVFSATLTGGAPGPVLLNLSQSSGILNPPFTVPGAIRPEGAFDLPAGLGRLMLDRNLDQLVWLGAQGGPPAALLSNVKELNAVARSGDQWTLLVRRSNAGQAREVVRWSSASPQLASVLFSSVTATNLAEQSLRGNTCAFLEHTATRDNLQACDLVNGNVYLFSTRNFVYGPALAIASNGTLTTSLGTAQAPAVFVAWQPGSNPLRLGQVNSPGFVLRGL